MPQISLYVDDATMEALRVSARGQGVSMSRYVAGLIADREHYGAWPQGYWESIYGALDEDLDIGDSELDPSLDDSCDFFE